MYDLGGSPSQFRSDDIVIDDNPHLGVENYRILRFLGKGGFAECYAAKVLSNGADVALKIVEKTKLRDSGYTKMKREISIHKMALHKNIVSMLDSFEDSKNFYLVLELCNYHSLLTVINTAYGQRGTCMNMHVVRNYLYGILSAVDYLLDRNILHRDIKPGNIFIGNDREVKLGDFGLAIEMKDLHSASVSGTPNYLAPEVLQRKGHSESSEVWSIGCLLYCMMTGLPPFETESIEKTYIKIAHGDYKITMGIKATPVVSEIISQCLSVNPKSRPRVKTLLRYPWFVDNLPKDSHMSPRYLTNQAALTRTKSVGDMLKDANGNYFKFSRPKSTVGGLQDSSYLSDRTRRKSITGSHDSGFGSEVDMSRRPLLMERITQVQKDLRSILEGHLTLIPCAFTGIYISKWVDYSNSRGFACKLSDGSVTVKFNEGSCLTIPPYSTRFIYASSPFSVPKICDMCTTRPSMESQLFDTAVVYGSYMDKELAGGQTIPFFRFSIVDAPYIVYYRLSADHLIVVLSDGTIQINLFNEKVKIILWKETVEHDGHICITFLTQGFDMQTFRVHPPTTTNPSLKTPMISHLEDYFQHISTIISANCDLISPKKPPLSTEC
ncbi:unnamed protein product [Auanema sp. JU1783]|nr:unnamed protein product [Auanema sp. JU1783]